MIDVIGSTPWLFKQPNGAKDEVMGGARSKPDPQREEVEDVRAWIPDDKGA